MKATERNAVVSGLEIKTSPRETVIKGDAVILYLCCKIHM